MAKEATEPRHDCGPAPPTISREEALPQGLVGLTADDPTPQTTTITREEAVERHLRLYYTGKPCRYGHVAVRRACNATCVECERDVEKARARYQRHRANSPEKVRARYQRYAANNPEKVRASRRRWRVNNPEKVRAGSWQYQFKQYQRGAKIRGLAWELTKERFDELTLSNCVYCNAPPVPRNGLDRKNNSIGYTDTNSVPCCKICNFAKRTMPYADFLQWLDRAALHRLMVEIDAPVDHRHLPPASGMTDARCAALLARVHGSRLTPADIYRMRVV